MGGAWRQVSRPQTSLSAPKASSGEVRRSLSSAHVFDYAPALFASDRSGPITDRAGGPSGIPAACFLSTEAADQSVLVMLGKAVQSRSRAIVATSRGHIPHYATTGAEAGDASEQDAAGASRRGGGAAWEDEHVHTAIHDHTVRRGREITHSEHPG